MKRWKTTTAVLIVLALVATPALARPATAADVPTVMERLASWLAFLWTEEAARDVPAVETTVWQRSGEGEEDDGTVVPPPLDESLLTIDPSG